MMSSGEHLSHCPICVRELRLDTSGNPYPCECGWWPHEPTYLQRRAMAKGFVFQECPDSQREIDRITGGRTPSREEIEA